MLVIYPSSTDITHPGRKIGDGDEFVDQPGVISYLAEPHLSARAFFAGPGGLVIDH
jgi:hypothetical protein